MLWFLFSQSIKLLLDLQFIRTRPNHDKDLQILLLRQQVRILQRTLHRPPRLSREGLFELGTEDSYSQRPYPSERLHDHVERAKDECWRLHVAPVVDPKRKPLGWSLCVVLYPTLSSEADEDEIEAAKSAHVLELRHFHTYSEATLAI